jgi:hypothetical protein
MEKLPYKNAWESARDQRLEELREVERRAGIGVEAEQLSYRGNYENCLAIRDLYFGVSDTALTCELIQKWCAYEQAIIDDLENDVSEAARRVERLKEDGGSKWWVHAAVWGVILVALGAGLFGVYGAIGGALGGYFLGKGVVADGQRRHREELRDARQNLRLQRRDLREYRSDGRNWFTGSEAESGQPE